MTVTVDYASSFIVQRMGNLSTCTGKSRKIKQIKQHRNISGYAIGHRENGNFALNTDHFEDSTSREKQKKFRLFRRAFRFCKTKKVSVSWFGFLWRRHVYKNNRRVDTLQSNWLTEDCRNDQENVRVKSLHDFWSYFNNKTHFVVPEGANRSEGERSRTRLTEGSWSESYRRSQSEWRRPRQGASQVRIL